MTTKSRQRGGAATPDPAETPAETPAQTPDQTPAGGDGQADGQGEQPASTPPAAQPQGSGSTEPQASTDTPSPADAPEPTKVDRGMVRPETGLSPEPFAGGDVPTAPTGDDKRNGQPTGIGTTSKLHGQADNPTAATGGTVNNGLPVNTAGMTNTGFGGNGDPAAKLAGDGVRAEVGAGTLNPDLPPDERPTYPSSTLTRSSSRAAPMEPEDAKRAHEPRLGYVETSTDPVAAASAIQSHAGDQTVELLDEAGNAVRPSEFLEVPEEIGTARGFRRVTMRVSEVYTVRNVKSPSRRLLFIKGQLIPVAMAEMLVDLHG